MHGAFCFQPPGTQVFDDSIKSAGYIIKGTRVRAHAKDKAGIKPFLCGTAMPAAGGRPFATACNPRCKEPRQGRICDLSLSQRDLSPCRSDLSLFLLQALAVSPASSA